MSFEKKLKMAGKVWGKAREKAEENSGFDNEMEDGRYVAAVASGEIGESQNGRLQVTWEYIILEGAYEGKTVRDYDGIETEENQVWLARKLARLGYEVPEDLEDVEDTLKDIGKTKPKVRIRIKTKGEYQNVYIDKLLGASHESDEGDEGSEEEGAPDSEGEEVEMEVGMKVKVTLKKGEIEAEIVEILEDEEKVRVKDEDGKVYRVSFEKIELLEQEEKTDAGEEEEEEEEEEEVEEVPEEPEAEEEEPPKKVKKKSPKKAKKKKGRK